jgi:hypothetical protein
MRVLLVSDLHSAWGNIKDIVDAAKVDGAL